MFVLQLENGLFVCLVLRGMRDGHAADSVHTDSRKLHGVYVVVLFKLIDFRQSNAVETLPK